MMKKLFFSFCLAGMLALGLCACAVSQEDVEYPYIEIDYSYPCVAGGTMSSGFTYSDEMLLGDAHDFSTDLAKASVALSMAVYNESYINSVLSDMEYTKWFSKHYDTLHITNSHHVAYSIARKEIVDRDGNKKMIYCVPIRGTARNSEWYSDFTIGNTDDHEGFYVAASRVKETLYHILEGDAYSADQTIIWLTGHSRGAAVANIIAGEMTKSGAYASASGIFAYTFACPSVSKNADPSLGNIFNFNNPGDLIPTLPLQEWGYKRYGQTRLLDLGHKDNFARRFRRELAQTYAGATTDKQWLEMLKTFFPTEADIHSPQATFVLHLGAWMLSGGKSADTSLPEMIQYVAQDSLDDDLVLQMINNSVDVLGLERDAEEMKNDLTNGSNFVQNHRGELLNMTEEEYKEFAAQHSFSIAEIVSLTGKQISNATDLLVFASSAPGQVKKVAWLLEGIGIARDIFCDAGTLNIADTITHGHTQSSYVLWINSMYYGYEGWYGNAVTVKSIPSNVENISARCFYMCPNLEAFDFHENVRHIGTEAFAGCNSLKSVILPEGAKSLGENAFSRCPKLTYLQMPLSCRYDAGQSYDAYGTFHYCTAIETVVYTAGDGTVFEPAEYNGTISSAPAVPGGTYAGKDTLKKVFFADGVKRVPAYVLYGSAALEEVSLAETVESIGDCAFRNCTALKAMALPQGVKQIGDGAFYGCSAMAQANIQEGIESIGKEAFSGCKALTGTLALPEGMKTLAENAFYGCSGLEEVVIPESMQTIGSKAFSYCTGLKRLKLPISCQYDAGRKSDTYGTFYQCSGLEEVAYTLGDGTIFEPAQNNGTISAAPSFPGANNAGQGTLKKVTFEDGITKLPDYMLYRCSALEEIKLSNAMETIGDYALYLCKSVKTVELPQTVKQIGAFAFNGSSTMEQVNIPAGVKSIGDSAFAGCTALREVYIPKTVESIGKDAFSSCRNLLSFTFEHTADDILTIGSRAFFVGDSTATTFFVPDPENVHAALSTRYWTSERRDINYTVIPVIVESILISAGDAPFVRNVPAALTVEVLPETITAEQILWSVTPESVARITPEGEITFSRAGFALVRAGVINSDAFAELMLECEGETVLILPGELKRIDAQAFAGVAAEVVVMAQGTEKIGSQAFANCPNLYKVMIPDTVTQIESDAFTGSPYATICAKAESYAAQYAQEAGVNFLPREETAVQ